MHQSLHTHVCTGWARRGDCGCSHLGAQALPVPAVLWWHPPNNALLLCVSSEAAFWGVGSVCVCLWILSPAWSDMRCLQTVSYYTRHLGSLGSAVWDGEAARGVRLERQIGPGPGEWRCRGKTVQTNSAWGILGFGDRRNAGIPLVILSISSFLVSYHRSLGSSPQSATCSFAVLSELHHAVGLRGRELLHIWLMALALVLRVTGT